MFYSIYKSNYSNKNFEWIYLTFLKEISIYWDKKFKIVYRNIFTANIFVIFSAKMPYLKYKIEIGVIAFVFLFLKMV